MDGSEWQLLVSLDSFVTISALGNQCQLSLSSGLPFYIHGGMNSSFYCQSELTMNFFTSSCLINDISSLEMSAKNGCILRFKLEYLYSIANLDGELLIWYLI